MRQRRKRRSKVNSINYGGTTNYINATAKMETKKRKTIWPFLIGLVLIVVIAYGGYQWYQGMQEKANIIVEIEMDDPTLPRMVTISEGYEMNELIPYTMEMELTTMRDALSILTPQGKLNLEIKAYDSEVTSLSYGVYSADGSKLLEENVVTEITDDQVTLSLGNSVTSVEESILQITMTLGDGTEIYYYTRVIAYGSCYLSQNLDFVAQFHADTLAKDTEAVEVYLNSSTTTSSSYQLVNMSTDVEQVTWGDLDIDIMGDVSWTITECTSLFIAIQLEYQVSILGDVDEDGVQEIEYYNVQEAYRVGYSTSNGAVSLKQYQRTMEQIFKIDDSTVTSEGINLGVVGADNIIYSSNDDGSAVAFVQERALYIYQESTNEIISVFTLEQINTEDSRYSNQEYDIRILSISEDGSMNFVVYGYMNRGTHEGNVGAAIYTFDSLTQTVEEKAFITNTQSFDVGQDEMSNGIYYSKDLEVIYVIAQEALYVVDLLENEQEVLSSDMSGASHVISDDGQLIAFVTNGEDTENTCTVLNFETGESYSITTMGESKIQPLGFLNHHMIYGEYNETDTLVDETGSEITPMYMIGITDEEGVIQKTYEQDNLYIRNISISNNMVTMNMVELLDGEYVYVGQDVITNNETQETSNVTLGTFTTEVMLQQVQLAFTIDEDAVEEVEKSSAKLVANDSVIRISYDNTVETGLYYAYAYGELQVVSSMVSDAIQYASANVGSVVNSSNKYVWRSGYRDLTYTLTNYTDLKTRMTNGESAIQIVAESANYNVVSYTGCTTEQMCYLINNGQLIAAKLEDDSWVLLVGYTGTTMYYINSEGTKVSATMTTLDAEVIELIGNGIF